MMSIPRSRVAQAMMAVAAALGLALVVTPWLMPSSRLQAAFIAEAERRTGLEVRVEGGASASAFPWPHVNLKLVRIGTGGTAVPLVAANDVVGQLQLMPLLRGEIIFSGYRLDKAHLSLPLVVASGQTNWNDVVEATKRLADDKSAGIALPMFSLENSTLEVLDENGRVHFDMTDLSLQANWPGMGQSASAKGEGVVMGEKAAFEVVLASPSAVALGKKTGLSVLIDAPLLKASFEGDLAAGHRSVADGTLTVSSPSLKSSINWLQRRGSARSDVQDAFSVSGQAIISNGTISLSRARAMLAGNEAQGALSANEQNGRISVRGTLDAQKIDISPYVSDYSPSVATEAGGWNRKPIDFAVLNSTDVDVRLSAQQLVIGSVTVQEAAAIAIAREGRMTITLGEAKSHGGTVKGSLTITSIKDAQSADLAGDMALADVELGQGLAEWFGMKRLQGKGTIRLSLTSRGSSVQELMRNLGGRGRLTAADGQIAGVDAETILTKLERRPLSAATGIDTRSGQTPYQTLTSDIAIAGGVATTQNLLLESPSVKVALGGSLTLPTRDVDMKGVATLKRAKDSPFELPFMVRGTWDDPFFLPDGDNLIRRSTAASPLRDVTRDRDKLRAVEDSIRRAGMPLDAHPAPSLPIQISPFLAFPPQ